MQEVKYIHSNLIQVDLNAETWDEVLIKLSKNLISKGFVKESYLNAVIEREKEFPTGLPTDGIGVAIPHTDIQHVIKPCIAVGVLGRPVRFNAMDDPTEGIDVKIVFMLAINDSKDQLKILNRLITIFQENELLLKITKARSPKEVCCLLNLSFKFEKVV